MPVPRSIVARLGPPPHRLLDYMLFYKNLSNPSDWWQTMRAQSVGVLQRSSPLIDIQGCLLHWRIRPQPPRLEIYRLVVLILRNAGEKNVNTI